MVGFSHMGRGICPWYDAAWHMEWDKRPPILCEAFPGAREGSNYRDGDKCDWRTAGKRWSGS